MDFDKLGEVVGADTDVGIDRHPRGGNLSLNRRMHPPHARGVSLHVQPAVQRVPPALDRGQFALRVGGQQQHVGGWVIEIAHPRRHHREPSLPRRQRAVVPAHDLPAVAVRAHDQRVRWVERARRGDPGGDQVHYLLARFEARIIRVGIQPVQRKFTDGVGHIQCTL